MEWQLKPLQQPLKITELFYILKVLSQFKSYLKNESTNSYLLNTCKSSIPSPTPIYFTGI